jgi:hypothetical protein
VVARKCRPPIALTARDKYGLALFVGESIERLLDGLELDPKVRSVASDGMICRRQACSDGEQRCGRRSTVEFIDARAAGIRAICGTRSGRGWSR